MKVRPESFVRLVYPFLFDGESFAARQEQVNAAAYDGTRRLWEAADFPATEVLPHVAAYLNPSADVEPTACLWQVSADALQSLQGIGAAHNIQWRLTTPQKQHIPLVIENVQLTMFRIGVGLLSIRLSFSTEELADWFDGLHYVRFLHRDGVSLSVRRRTRQATEQDDGFSDFFPPVAGPPASAGSARTFAELFDGLLQTSSLADETGPWWQEVFITRQALPYIGLFFDDAAESEDAVPLSTDCTTLLRADQQIFPSAQDLQLDQEHLLPYAHSAMVVILPRRRRLCGLPIARHALFSGDTARTCRRRILPAVRHGGASTFRPDGAVFGRGPLLDAPGGLGAASQRNVAGTDFPPDPPAAAVVHAQGILRPVSRCSGGTIIAAT